MQPPATTPSRAESVPYQLFMLALCVLALGALGFETAANPGEETRTLLHYADTAVCGLFFIDFCLSLWKAENRLRYFMTWGWLDLISSIPSLDAARWGRIARATRIFRVVRAMRATTLLGRALIERRAQTGIFAAALTAILLLIGSSISILQVETTPQANITGAEDAIWWSLSTMTTVGYGDRFPVTTEGRVVAALLMCAGVGLFGMFSGFLASVFVAPGQDSEASEVAALRRDIAELRAMLVARGERATDG
ncbi:MAG: ion transporter [Vicinamibacterales bacterium]